MMFEVADLSQASPATVSRCGMVYLEPSILGLQPFIECWMKKLPDAIFKHYEQINQLFANFLEVSHQIHSNFIKSYTDLSFSSHP